MTFKQIRISKKSILFFLFYSGCVFSDANSVMWKGEYYNALPIKKGVDKRYCEAHTPGIFTHKVKEALHHPIYTDKEIKLANAKYTVDKVDGIYLIQGSFVAGGKQDNKPWQETIHYFLFKKSEYGFTQGVWYTDNCKGLYRGTLVKNNKIKETT